MDAETNNRRKKATAKALRRIAQLKIQAYNLSDTPESYIRKCQQKENPR